MITISVKDALNGNVPLTDEAYGVYVVRDGQTKIYVGKTERQDIVDRISWHLGNGPFTKVSPLGRYIIKNKPRSHNWKIDILSLDDCNQIFEERGLPRRRKIRTAETTLIHLYHPLINKQANDSTR